MQQTTSTNDTTALSIALIEDDIVDYHWIGGMLKRIPDCNFSFQWAKSFEEGETLLAGQTFDIAFIDNAIGIRSGIDIVRNLGGRSAATPMVMLTGSGTHTLDCEAMDAGVYDFLEKGSISTEELERSIRYTLNTRQLEQELQEAKDAAIKADHAKAHFLAHLSHDLRTPLNTIAGFSEMISRNQENLPDSRQYATQILSSAKHLEDMIEDLLALTNFDLQKTESIPRHYFLQALIEEAQALTQGPAQDRQVQIKPLYSVDDLEIFGDRKAIKRILVNLISVSIKHSHQGGTIFVACGQDEKGISILVSDDGTGIDQHTIKEVVSAGPYAADAYTTSSNGIGLSLSIVYQYVLMHSGKMLVDSKIDGGTVVEIFFPHEVENPNVI